MRITFWDIIIFVVLIKAGPIAALTSFMWGLLGLLVLGGFYFRLKESKVIKAKQKAKEAEMLKLYGPNWKKLRLN